ncbi:MAG: hypothetical protein LBB74_06230 [Chitinispirillales bacterium]|jgi:hypothetical protein|nr:hypothetical protein [Chitinispirillales bacterium]
MSEAEIKEEEIKHYVFVKNGRVHYAPQAISSGETAIHWIFPVPEPAAVGTLDDNSNGIVLVKFGDYGKLPENTVVVKDYGDSVYDMYHYRFSPNYADDTIAYTQNQVAVIADVKIGEAFYVRCGLSPNDCLLGIRFLDPQDKLFVIAKAIKGGKPKKDSYLYVVKLEGQNFIDTGWSMYTGKIDDDAISPHFPLYHTWQVHDRKLFVYDKERRKIVCTDGKESVSHPFSEIFNANAKLFHIVKDIAIHPNLPFVVIIEENIYGTHDLVVLRWDIASSKEKAKQILSFGPILEELLALFGLKRLALAYQSFSPDGNWYVVGYVGRAVGNESRSPHFVAIPVVLVDKKHPDFLDTDNLVVLGQVAGYSLDARADVLRSLQRGDSV